MLYCGKPYAPIYEAALAKAAALRGKPTPLDRVLAIGDLVRTDLKGRLRSGLIACSSFPDCMPTTPVATGAGSGGPERDLRGCGRCAESDHAPIGVVTSWHSSASRDCASIFGPRDALLDLPPEQRHLRAAQVLPEPIGANDAETLCGRARRCADAGLHGAVVAMGNFDGVHRGHRAVIAAAQQRAEALGKPAAVLTFEPHPRAFFRPDEPLFRLTDEAAKLRCSLRPDFDGAFVLTFDAALARLTADEFVTGIFGRPFRHQLAP